MLKDIAYIRDEFTEGERFSEYNGKPVISIQVLSVGDQSELDISATVHKFVEEKADSIARRRVHRGVGGCQLLPERPTRHDGQEPGHGCCAWCS